MLAPVKPSSPREIALQVAFFGLLVAIAATFVINLHANMAAQHVTSGFSFLERATGWDIGFSILPLSIRDPYWKTLLAGLLNTVAVGVVGLVFATMLGLTIAAMRVFGNPVFATAAKAYVEVIRNIPPLLQLLAWYAMFTSLPPVRAAYQPIPSIYLSTRGIFLPGLNVHWTCGVVLVVCAAAAFAYLVWWTFSLRLAFVSRKSRILHAAIVLSGCAAIACTGVALGVQPGPLVDRPVLAGLNMRGGQHVPPELAAILFATVCYGAAYAAEIIRSGFVGIEPGKVEAGKALGLGPWTIFARIQIPLVAAAVMPMMTNLYVWLMKATTLGIAIGFADLFMVSVSAINQSGQTMEILLIVAIAFWCLNATIVLLMSRLATHLNRWS